MSKRLYDATEICLAALRSGVGLDRCLALYPDLEDELRPALEAALATRRMSEITIPTAAMSRSRAKMLAEARRLKMVRRPIFSINWTIARQIALIGLALLVVGLLSWHGLWNASATTLPGDALYNVKRVAETVSLDLANDLEARSQIEADYRQRRIDETRNLLSMHRVELASLEGRLTQQNGMDWVVAGIPVRLTGTTRQIGVIRPGDVIEVEGQTQPDGTLLAHEVHLRLYTIAGQVEAIGPAAWKISGKQYRLQSSTQIDPSLQVGQRVLVLVYSSDDGVVYANAILRSDNENVSPASRGAAEPSDALKPANPAVPTVSVPESHPAPGAKTDAIQPAGAATPEPRETAEPKSRETLHSQSGPKSNDSQNPSPDEERTRDHGGPDNNHPSPDKPEPPDHNRLSDQ